MILISNVRTSASKKINLMALIRTLTISTTTFERMKEKFHGLRQTERASDKNKILQGLSYKVYPTSLPRFKTIESSVLIPGKSAILPECLFSML